MSSLRQSPMGLMNVRDANGHFERFYFDARNPNSPYIPLNLLPGIGWYETKRWGRIRMFPHYNPLPMFGLRVKW